MLIYKSMTIEQWQDLKARTEALLATDLKEYHSFEALYWEHVKALEEWTLSRTEIDVFRRGNPQVYMTRLRDVLSRIKRITRYPRLISPEHPAKALYIASVPYHPSAQIPGSSTPPPAANPFEESPEWTRFMAFDSYKDSLTPELRNEGEGISDLFADRRRLHELAKNQERAKVAKEAIAQTLADMDTREAQIKNYFDRVEAYMTGKENAPSGQAIKPMDESKPTGTYTKDEIEAMVATNPVYAALCKEKRREANCKFITRMDLKKPKDPEELALRIRELEEWGWPVPKTGIVPEEDDNKYGYDE